MIKELTQEKKVKLTKDIEKIIQIKDKTNVEKMKLVSQLVIRVSKEQQLAYRKLATETKKPISKIVRNNLDDLVKQRTTATKQTPQQKKDNFLKFQKKLGLI